MRSRALARLAVCAVMAAPGAAGCSTGDATPERAYARIATETLLRACARDDPLAVLDLLNQASKRAFVAAQGTSDGCEAVLGVPPAGTRVTAVERDGDSARVTLQANDGRRATVEAESDGDKWVVTNARLPG
jgi:hypothetical protein